MRLSLRRFLPGHDALHRRGDGSAARPLVAVLDLRRRLAYWRNLTEAASGWVFKARLSDFYRGEEWPPEPLSSRERRFLGVSSIRSHLRSQLHARYTILSDVGTTQPGAAESRATRWLEPDQELLLVEYEVLGSRPYYQLTNACHDAGAC